jgi:hypothetical protein
VVGAAYTVLGLDPAPSIALLLAFVLYQQRLAVHVKRKLHAFAMLILDAHEGVHFDERLYILVRDVRALVHQTVKITRGLYHYRLAIDEPTTVTAFFNHHDLSFLPIPLEAVINALTP